MPPQNLTAVSETFGSFTRRRGTYRLSGVRHGIRHTFCSLLPFTNYISTIIKELNSTCSFPGGTVMSDNLFWVLRIICFARGAACRLESTSIFHFLSRSVFNARFWILRGFFFFFFLTFVISLLSCFKGSIIYKSRRRAARRRHMFVMRQECIDI